VDDLVCEESLVILVVTTLLEYLVGPYLVSGLSCVKESFLVLRGKSS
jgi:hypothetical protein